MVKKRMFEEEALTFERLNDFDIDLLPDSDLFLVEEDKHLKTVLSLIEEFYQNGGAVVVRAVKDQTAPFGMRVVDGRKSIFAARVARDRALDDGRKNVAKSLATVTLILYAEETPESLVRRIDIMTDTQRVTNHRTFLANVRAEYKDGKTEEQVAKENGIPIPSFRRMTSLIGGYGRFLNDMLLGLYLQGHMARNAAEKANALTQEKQSLLVKQYEEALHKWLMTEDTGDGTTKRPRITMTDVERLSDAGANVEQQKFMDDLFDDIDESDIPMPVIEKVEAPQKPAPDDSKIAIAYTRAVNALYDIRSLVNGLYDAYPDFTHPDLDMIVAACEIALN